MVVAIQRCPCSSKQSGDLVPALRIDLAVAKRPVWHREPDILGRDRRPPPDQHHANGQGEAAQSDGKSVRA
jgi:hypothetical protein